MLTDGVDSQKFADCSNGAGMTALHVAAMKGSPQVRQMAKCQADLHIVVHFLNGSDGLEPACLD